MSKYFIGRLKSPLFSQMQWTEDDPLLKEKILLRNYNSSKHKDISTQQRACSELSRFYFTEKNFPKAIKYAMEEVTLCKLLDISKQADARRHLGDCYSARRETFRFGLQQYLLCLQLANKMKSKRELLKAYDALGNWYISPFNKGHAREDFYVQRALECFKKSLKIVEKINVSKDEKDTLLGDAYLNISICYRLSDDHKEAIKYLEKAIEQHEKRALKDPDDLESSQRLMKDYYNLGQVYRDMGDFEASLTVLFRAERQCCPTNHSDRHDIFGEIGQTFVEYAHTEESFQKVREKFSKAELYFRKQSKNAAQYLDNDSKNDCDKNMDYINSVIKAANKYQIAINRFHEETNRVEKIRLLDKIILLCDTMEHFRLKIKWLKQKLVFEKSVNLYVALGEAYFFLDDISESLKYYHLAYDYSITKEQTSEHLALCLVNLGNVYTFALLSPRNKYNLPSHIVWKGKTVPTLTAAKMMVDESLHILNSPMCSKCPDKKEWCKLSTDNREKLNVFENELGKKRKATTQNDNHIAKKIHT